MNEYDASNNSYSVKLDNTVETQFTINLLTVHLSYLSSHEK